MGPRNPNSVRREVWISERRTEQFSSTEYASKSLVPSLSYEFPLILPYRFEGFDFNVLMIQTLELTTAIRATSESLLLSTYINKSIDDSRSLNPTGSACDIVCLTPTCT